MPRLAKTRHSHLAYHGRGPLYTLTGGRHRGSVVCDREFGFTSLSLHVYGLYALGRSILHIAIDPRSEIRFSHRLVGLHKHPSPCAPRTSAGAANSSAYLQVAMSLIVLLSQSGAVVAKRQSRISSGCGGT